MSNNFVERFCHRHFQKNPKKSKEEILNNLTHLYLNGRKLEEIVKPLREYKFKIELRKFAFAGRYLMRTVESTLSTQQLHSANSKFE